MPNTLQQRDRLMIKLSDLLDETPEEDRPETMRNAIQAFVSARLLPEEVASQIRMDDPLSFAKDLIGDNEMLPGHLNLHPKAYQRAMNAREALQLVQTLA